MIKARVRWACSELEAMYRQEQSSLLGLLAKAQIMEIAGMPHREAAAFYDEQAARYDKIIDEITKAAEVEIDGDDLAGVMA